MSVMHLVVTDAEEVLTSVLSSSVVEPDPLERNVLLLVVQESGGGWVRG